MSWPDVVNGGCETIGGLLILNHCRAVLRDKAVAGVSLVSVVLFTGWGFWNLFYYPSLNQWWSFTGGLIVVSANLLWACLLFRYRGQACRLSG